MTNVLDPHPRRFTATVSPHAAAPSPRLRPGADGRCGLPCHDAFDRTTLGDLRSDHAGETGAVWIYRGVLAVARDVGLRRFAEEHLATEQRHLEAIESVLAAEHRSCLLPLWRVSGWITGALPALFGPAAVYRTVAAVETFVDRHYQQQIDRLDALQAHPDLRAMLESCRSDELHHRDDAARRVPGPAGWLARGWAICVGAGSALAVGVCRRI
jgi:3-demethoxyubiquinol 3-hydroxylase